MKDLERRYDKLRILEAMRGFKEERIWRQLGSLGGGNHFIEICLDVEGAVWIMLHSGSRGIGNKIGETAMRVAKEVAEKIDRQLPHRDLAWLDEGTPEFEAYVEGLHWAQEYAALNRDRYDLLLVAASFETADLGADGTAVGHLPQPIDPAALDREVRRVSPRR